MHGEPLCETRGVPTCDKSSGGKSEAWEEQLRANSDAVVHKIFGCRRCFGVSLVRAPNLSCKILIGFLGARKADVIATQASLLHSEGAKLAEVLKV